MLDWSTKPTPWGRGDEVKIVATADEKTHTAIEYVGVIVSASAKKEAAAAIQKMLTSDAGQKAMEAAGLHPGRRGSCNPGEPVA